MHRLVLLAPLLLGLIGCQEPSWSVVHSDLPEGLINVWGRSASDVYVVGSDAGAGPIVLRYDGERWSRLETGERGDLWWVNGREEGAIYMGGSRGMILRYDGAGFERMPTPDDGTVFGIWVAAEDDVWAVGGYGDRAGFAWRYDGAAWSAIEVPELQNRGLFKVWGTAADDVWIVGAADEAAGLSAALYHWDGAALTAVESGVGKTLFTVHLAGDRAAAAGGAGSAAMIEREGGAWVDRSPAFVPSLIGVWLTGDDDGWSVGAYGTVARRSAEGWVVQETDFAWVPAFHSVWVDDEGGVWAVGGQVLASPLSRGVLVHRGLAAPSSLIEER